MWVLEREEPFLPPEAVVVLALPQVLPFSRPQAASCPWASFQRELLQAWEEALQLWVCTLP
jgi:hypothetical protein